MFTVLSFAVKQVKKQRTRKQQFQQPQPPYPNDQYPMAQYPAGVAPGGNYEYPNSAPPSVPESKASKFMAGCISFLRFLQLVFGLTVIGLYGRDVHHDHKYEDTWNSKWVYALVTGFLATSTALAHMVLPFCMSRTGASNPALRLPQFAWEFVLCVLWLTLFGLFGKIYLGVYAVDVSVETSSSSSRRSTTTSDDAAKINRMRHAVWIDLVNLLFWLVTASWVLLQWLKGRKVASSGEKGEEV
ncbi:hypothetical protein N7495_000859 [Penicillium taxi]|uniref:uncharacterized protein n=1 Tax=Penicillium taxi TaxID=168475 RepID=UPI0025452DDD|nr:uncharacterized protein N7495_000859 [Penicillium taxi]KAJ5908177.1 hypothetical protein N7495_000859 [Penicillium taxi]